MNIFVCELLLAVSIIPLLLHGVHAAEKEWIDRDRVYCGHINCKQVATYKGEKFCSPCDTRHYCECKETDEPLPFLRTCHGTTPCQISDRRGSCHRTMGDAPCEAIDKRYRDV